MQQSELKSLRNLLACSLFPVIQKLSSEEITGIKKEKMKKKKEGKQNFISTISKI